ncbi:hypothetical protein [Lentzea flava]|uniref:hypothetical protein n=1 Tax=Lentzea flava TaxID=103732 RepID=UPI0016711CB5|nr:hypothetical protein [Lentzea flava]
MHRLAEQDRVSAHLAHVEVEQKLNPFGGESEPVLQRVMDRPAQIHEFVATDGARVLCQGE